jgi:DNA-binding transcriptional ArsR family regulator
MHSKHILVSLGDDKVKQIGEVVGSKTCNKILDLLIEKEMTVTDISEKLKIPLNTTSYNVKKLVKTGLIEKTGHWWSVKGRRMDSYKVSNKKIIISPKESIGKTFAWIFGLTGLTALTIREFMKPISKQIAPDMLFSAKSSFAVEEAAVFASDAVVTQAGFWSSINPWTWFLFGAWFSIMLFIISTIYNDKKDRGTL